MDYQDYKRMNDALEYQYKNNGCSGSVLRIVNVDISKGLCQLNTGTVTYIANLVAATMSGMGCVSNPSMLAQWGGYSNLGASSAPIMQNTTPVIQGTSVRSGGVPISNQSASKMKLEIDEGVTLSKSAPTELDIVADKINKIAHHIASVYDFKKYKDKIVYENGKENSDEKPGGVYIAHPDIEVSDFTKVSTLEQLSKEGQTIYRCLIDFDLDADDCILIEPFQENGKFISNKFMVSLSSDWVLKHCDISLKSIGLYDFVDRFKGRGVVGTYEELMSLQKEGSKKKFKPLTRTQYTEHAKNAWRLAKHISKIAKDRGIKEAALDDKCISFLGYMKNGADFDVDEQDSLGLEHFNLNGAGLFDVDTGLIHKVIYENYTKLLNNEEDATKRGIFQLRIDINLGRVDNDYTGAVVYWNLPLTEELVYSNDEYELELLENNSTMELDKFVDGSSVAYWGGDDVKVLYEKYKGIYKTLVDKVLFSKQNTPSIKPDARLSKKELEKVADNMYLFRKHLDKFFAKMGYSGLDFGDGLYSDSSDWDYLENKDGDVYKEHQEVSDTVYNSYLRRSGYVDDTQRSGYIDDRMSLSIDKADAAIAPYLSFDFATNSFSFYIYFFTDKNGDDEYYENYNETATDLKELYQRITQPNSLFLQHFNKIVKIINGGN